MLSNVRQDLKFVLSASGMSARKDMIVGLEIAAHWACRTHSRVIAMSYFSGGQNGMDKFNGEGDRNKLCPSKGFKNHPVNDRGTSPLIAFGNVLT